MAASSAVELTHTKLNRLFALLVFVISAVVYLLTVAPTVCFWDCGEYVAAGASLGVPHPPGNPLFILIARAVTIFFSFIRDAGLRLNLIAVFSSATMAMLMYCIVVRSFTGWMGLPDTAWKRVPVYTGGVVGGLFAAFGGTVWFSSVESEVNSPLLVPIALCTWLALVWAQSKSRDRDRLLVLITYIAFLGIGIHLYSMITLGPLFLYVILVDPEKRKDWRLWATGILMGTVIYDISWFVWAGVGVILVTLVASLFKGRRRRNWQLCFFIALFGMLGFSTHLYIPIRSALNPMIDENHPATYAAFRDYLERKQYGSESMITRMFWRRASWRHQFGIEGHMGFGGFFLTQFFHLSPHDTEEAAFAKGPREAAGKLAVYGTPVLLLLFGVFFLFRKDRKAAVLLTTLLLMTTVVLVLYMNFSDGSRCEQRDYNHWVKNGRQGSPPLVQREVRARDYFYIAGFMFYGMWIGIAAGSLLFALYGSKKKFLRTTAGPLCTILFAASPALPVTQNMGLQTRHGDFIPFDYAWNILMSCDKDGIVFTNGDNDTFPLWALQEAYGIRRDVRLVNLSLLNTRWYIRQLKHLDPKVPVSYSDNRIEKQLAHVYNANAEPTRCTLPQADITVSVPAHEKLGVLRIQDQMVLNIVDANEWKRPVYFSVTVSDNNMMGLTPFLRMEGLVYRVMPHELATERDRTDINRTMYLLDHVYRFTGLGDGSTPLNSTSQRLLSNYAAPYLQIALLLRKPLIEQKLVIERLEKEAAPDSASVLDNRKKAYADTLDLAVGKLTQCVGLMPSDWRPRALLHEILVSAGRLPEAEMRMRQALAIEPDNTEYLRLLAQVYEMQGKKTELSAIMRKLTGDSGDLWDRYATAAQNYAVAGAFDSAIGVMRQYGALNPNDGRALQAIDQLEQIKKMKKK